MSDEKVFDKMIRAMDFIRTTVGELGLQQMMILFTVFEKEGITQYEITERFNFHQGSVSKNCKKLSTFETVDIRTGDKLTMGLDLIKLIPSVTEYRKLECHLTNKGKNIRKLLLEVLN
jgi:DNA-binding MarR family transcriptional regulator